MDTHITLYFERADNELNLAEAILAFSERTDLKEQLRINSAHTFYSAVIGHAYYSMFYTAIAYLLSKNIKVIAGQGQHQRVYFAFKKLVMRGIVDKEILALYEDVRIKAEVLLDILKSERKKRTEFTYERIPQANKDPAEKSVQHAQLFLKCLRRMAPSK